MEHLEARVVTVHDAKWFEENKGLRNSGLDITDLDNHHANVEEINSFFGPRNSKNGWWYHKRPNAEKVAEIKFLYCGVTGHDKVCNKTLNLHFARAVVVEAKGIDVNWAEFAAYTTRLRCQIKESKAASLARKIKEESFEGSLLPLRRSSSSQPFSKGGETSKHCIDLRKGVVEKVKMPPSRVLMPPQWSHVEIENTQTLLSSLKESFSHLQERFDEVGPHLEVVKLEAHKASTLLIAQRTLHAQALADVEACQHKIDVARANIQRNKSLSASLLSEATSGLTTNLEIKFQEFNTATAKELETIKEFEQDKAIEERNEKRALRRVIEFEEVVRVSAERCETAQSDFQRVSIRVSSTKSEVDKIVDLLLRMESGGGVTLYPRPIKNRPEDAIQTSQDLNACPVCHLWFSCKDYLCAECGHSYHPWCMLEHSRTSLQCLVPNCGQKFGEDWCVAWGVRPLQSRHQPCEGGFPNNVASPRERSYKSSGESATVDRTTEFHASNSAPQEPRAFPNSPHIYEGEIHEGFDALKAHAPTKSIFETTPLPQELCSCCFKDKANIRLESCGHSEFCFGCIQGLRECPICNSAIDGWHRIQTPGISQKMKPPTLSLVSALGDVVKHVKTKKTKNARTEDPNTKKKKIGKEPTMAPILSNTVLHDDDEGDCPAHELTDSDDEPSGLVRWSSKAPRRDYGGVLQGSNKGDLENNYVLMSNINPVLSPRIGHNLASLDNIFPKISNLGQENMCPLPAKKKPYKNPTIPNPDLPRRNTRKTGPIEPPTSSKKTKMMRDIAN